MLTLEELEVRNNKIENLLSKCENSLSESERELFKTEFEKVRTNHFSIEELNYKIESHREVIRSINSTFNHNVFKLGGIWLVVFIVISVLNDSSQFQILSVIVVTGLIVFYYVYKKNREIKDQRDRINSLESTIRVFMRDMKLQGIDGELVEGILDSRNRLNRHIDVDTLEIKDSDLPEHKRVQKILRIQFTQLELMSMKYLFPNLKPMKDENKFDRYLMKMYYDFEHFSFD